MFLKKIVELRGSEKGGDLNLSCVAVLLLLYRHGRNRDDSECKNNGNTAASGRARLA
jgi:hypothetical protein